MKVKDLMDKNFLRIYPEYDCKTVAELMYNKKRYSAAVVDKSDKLVGWVMSIDLAILDDKSIPITEIMHPKESVIYVREDDPAKDAVIKMVKYKVVSIPVLNSQDIVVGMVRHCDITKTLAKLYDIPVYKLFKALQKELKGISWEELMEAAAIVTKKTTGEDITPEMYEKRIKNTTFGQAIWACGGLEKFFVGLIKIGEIAIARKIGKKVKK